MFAGNTFTVTGTGRAGLTMVTIALADRVVSVNDVTVIVTVLPTGISAGAIYVVANLLLIVPAAIAGLNVPQALDPHVAVQATPPPAVSLVSCALTDNCVLTVREDGMAEAIATPTDNCVIVRLTLLLCAGLLVTVEVMVTVVPIGTSDGAV
jgi:hypothetical protein